MINTKMISRPYAAAVAVKNTQNTCRFSPLKKYGENVFNCPGAFSSEVTLSEQVATTALCAGVYFYSVLIRDRYSLVYL
jgi:hypothetical protein